MYLYKFTYAHIASFKKKLYWNHTLAWVFSYKFAAYFQNIFSYEHLWTAASGFSSSFEWNGGIVQWESFFN